jgi:hypothetical protein
VALQLFAVGLYQPPVEVRFVDRRERGHVLVLLIGTDPAQPLTGIGDYPTVEGDDDDDDNGVIIPMFFQEFAAEEAIAQLDLTPRLLRITTSNLPGPVVTFSSREFIDQAFARFGPGQTKAEVALDVESARRWGYLDLPRARTS